MWSTAHSIATLTTECKLRLVISCKIMAVHRTGCRINVLLFGNCLIVKTCKYLIICHILNSRTVSKDRSFWRHVAHMGALVSMLNGQTRFMWLLHLCGLLVYHLAVVFTQPTPQRMARLSSPELLVSLSWLVYPTLPQWPILVLIIGQPLGNRE